MENILTGLLVVALLCSLLALFFFIIAAQSSSRIRKQRRSKKKRDKVKITTMKRQRTRQQKGAIFFLILACISGVASGISLYRQSFRLTAIDSEAIVRSYYLTNDLDSQLVKLQKASDSSDKLEANLRYLANGIASYGTKKTSPLNSEEGQKKLNRYYHALQELGMNISRDLPEFYGNSELVEHYRTVLKKVTDYQKDALIFYKVDEEKLSKNRK